jgi:hypothetical protein
MNMEAELASTRKLRNIFLFRPGKSNRRSMSKNRRRRKDSFWELEGTSLCLKMNNFFTSCQYSFIPNMLFFCKYFCTVCPTSKTLFSLTCVHYLCILYGFFMSYSSEKIHSSS